MRYDSSEEEKICQKLADTLGEVQQQYLRLAEERCMIQDIHGVYMAYKRAMETGRRADKMRNQRWVA